MLKKSVEGSLLVTGSIALSAPTVLFQRKEEKIRASFPSFFVDETKHLLKEQSAEKVRKKEELLKIVKENKIREQYGIRTLYPLGDGGIFNALWNVCEELESGCEVELHRIPILQETVELCELFDINPYYTRSEGCFLIAAKRGNELSWLLKDEKIENEVVGALTSGRQRTILSGPDLKHVRCLDRPQPDSLGQFLKKWDAMQDPASQSEKIGVL